MAGTIRIEETPVKINKKVYDIHIIDSNIGLNRQPKSFERWEREEAGNCHTNRVSLFT